MRRAARLIAVLGLAWLAGCQGRASLQEVRGTLQPDDQRGRSTRASWYHNGADGRQSIVLAFEPTNAESGTSAVRATGGAADREPIRYRVYLLLEVQEGGGKFKIGQRIGGGQVRAFYWVYNEREEMVQAIPDRYGTIETRAWPFIGGLSADDWLLTGTFDLLMANDLKLTGTFTAPSGQFVVEKFLKEKRL